MEKFVGKWELEKNINLGKFLEYYGYNWFSIKAALLANVDAFFEKTEDPIIFKRTINSTFINGTENYILDNIFHTTPAKIEKKHSLIDGVIYSEVNNNGDLWTENIKIENDKLIINRFWEINKISLHSSQIFRKVL
jgi:hypothetical protein